MTQNDYTALFGTKKHVSTQERHPDLYFKHYYFEKHLCEGIGWLAKVRHVPVMQQANELMAKAFSDTTNDLIDQQADLQIAERYMEKNRDIVRFIMAFRKLAKEKGVNIDQIVPPIQTRPKKPKQ